jgi:HPt (histidine-containing phosphotransfer) domain-containing protein
LTVLPVLDPKPLRDLLEMGASAELAQELIALFQEDVPMRLGLLKAALDGGDAGQALAEAHQLKGSLGNLGLLRFADLAARLEAQVRSGRLDLAPALAEAMPGAYEEALRALQEAFPA